MLGVVGCCCSKMDIYYGENTLCIQLRCKFTCVVKSKMNIHSYREYLFLYTYGWNGNGVSQNITQCSRVLAACHFCTYPPCSTSFFHGEGCIQCHICGIQYELRWLIFLSVLIIRLIADDSRTDINALIRH